MSDWTLTTDDLRDYIRSTSKRRGADGVQEMVAEFDRWLTIVKAEAWEEGFADGVNHDIGDWENAPSIINNPYRQEKDA